MRTRILVGAILIPLVLVPIWLGGLWSVALFLIIGIVGGIEFYNMMQMGGYHPARWLGLAWLVALIVQGWLPDLIPLTTVLTAGLIATLIYALYQTEAPASTWMATSVGAIYLGVMIGQALALRLGNEGLWLLLLGVLVTWANDTAAYFTGVTIGKRKLWPRLSPKKTWEGTVGGWIAASLVGGLLVWLMPLSLSVPMGIVLGGLAGVLALFGDLSVSMIKRQVGAKDSGTIFPGHGGMLDRLDSLLFVLPFVYQVSLFFA